MSKQIIDTHVHVLWPQRFPYPDGPGYKPTHEIGHPDAMTAMMAEQGISHALLVQPGGYAFDNRPMYETMALHPGKFKAIGAFPLTASREELNAARRKGLIGVRLNLFSFDAGIFQNPAIHGFLKNCKDEDLFVEVFAPSKFWPEASPILRASGVALIIEHMGWPDLTQALDQAGFSSMLALADLPNVTVKLSCAFRLSAGGPPYDDVTPFAKKIVELFGIDRCIWGSDWPFLGPEQGLTVDQELAVLSKWVPDPRERAKVLTENPARIFGFS
jgi:predicted TIM-barrel fold metal-dependent hydrolase